MKENRLFGIDSSDSTTALAKWWNALEKNTGDRANLRRCVNATETAYIRASHTLFWALSKEHENVSQEKICAIAGLLSHVREDASTLLVRKMAQAKPGSEQPLFSELRFRRILQYKSITNEELFYQKMIRVIHHLDKKVNIRDIAYSLYYWGDSVKKNWAYDYYGAPKKEITETETQGETA
ncbi:MAG: type I-E CRISPR-associated protein Cse2/CasB [Spirochaetota bacterium]